MCIVPFVIYGHIKILKLDIVTGVECALKNMIIIVFGQVNVQEREIFVLLIYLLFQLVQQLLIQWLFYFQQNIVFYIQKKVNEINITGGNHELTIYSFVNELSIRGGINKVICNYEHSRINKIKSIGGQRDFFLNPNTEKAEQLNEGGTCKIHKTNIIPEEIWYQDSLSDNEIPITTVEDQKFNEPCSICLTDFKKGEEVYFLPCIHCYHILCLRKWVKSHKTCPTCKFRIKNKLAQ